MNTQSTFQSSLHDLRENQSRNIIATNYQHHPIPSPAQSRRTPPAYPFLSDSPVKEQTMQHLPLPGQIAEGLVKTFPAKAEQVSPIIRFRLKPEANPVGGSRDVGPLATRVNS
jgi:hypothetical protein